LLIKYIKSVLWRAAKCLSNIEEARCLKVKQSNGLGRKIYTAEMKLGFVLDAMRHAVGYGKKYEISSVAFSY